MNLSERFAASHGQPQEVDGHVVVQMARIPCKKGERLLLTMNRPKGQAGQGVRLKLAGGAFIVNGETQSDVVLWAATAPDVVEVSIARCKRTGGEVRVWNCWRGPQDQIMAWIGNAGIVVEHEGDSWRLECSDGKGDATFDDLIVEISKVG